MTVDRTLAKVEADLRNGEVGMARQRLRGLVASFPDRVDLRERLAEVYRREGDLAQAGRWSYISEALDPRERAAFERAYQDPFARMRALQWRGGEESVGAEAAVRLRALRDAAEAIAGAPVSWEDPRRPGPRQTLGGRIAEYGCLVLALAIAALALLGIGSLVATGIEVLVGWLR